MSVSVIILTHNRKGFLKATKEMFRAQSIVPEIVVALNDKRGAGVAECRNLAAASCKTDWLLFTYDDGIHMHDAVESLLRRARELGRQDVLINLHSVDVNLPTHFRMAKAKESMLYWGAMRRQGPRAKAMLAFMQGAPRPFWLEQHCSLIHREFFEHIGRYDAESFPGWSLHEQDLAIRVLRSGGKLDSSVNRNNGTPLFVFHRVRGRDPLAVQKRQWVENSQADFIRKYGERFTPAMVATLIKGAAA